MKKTFPKGYWTRSRCKSYSLKYNTPWEWGKNHPRSYQAAQKKGWLEYCTAHMQKRRMKWDVQELIAIIEKCKTVNQLRTKFANAYNAILRESKKNKNIKKSLSKLSTKRPSLSKFTPSFMRKEAKKYKSRKEFSRQGGGCHSAAKKYDKIHPGFFNSICRHMKPKGEHIWNKNNVFLEAKKYTSRRKFELGSSGAYQWALRYNRKKPGFMNKVCKHMYTKAEIQTRWTQEQLLKLSKKYKVKALFYKEQIQAYSAIYRYNKKCPGFARKCFKHMYIQPMRTRTRTELIRSAKRFKHRGNFQKYAHANWLAAWKINKKEPGFLDKICSHMVPAKNLWSTDRVLKEVKKYTTLKDFRNKSSGAYSWMLEYSRNENSKFRDLVYQNLERNNVERRELKAQKTFFHKLKRMFPKLKIVKELTLRKVRGRVDFFISFGLKCLAIEFKHDKSRWEKNEIQKQLKSYHRGLRHKKGFQGVLLVSPNGKYGLSSEECFRQIRTIFSY